MIKIKIIDSFGTKHQLKVERNSFPNLLELITHQFGEDIGDCKGRIWCGTCAVRLISGKVEKEIIQEEIELMSSFDLNKMEEVRLSCQIKVDENLHNTTWEVLDSRNFY